MNKYIKSDIQQGLTFFKIAITNALSDLESGREKEIQFETSLPLQLIIQCAEERGWEDDHEDDLTNGWEYDYWYRMKSSDGKKHLNIEGSLLCGSSFINIET